MTIVNVGSLPVSALAAEDMIRIPAGANLLDIARALVDADVGIVILWEP